MEHSNLHRLLSSLVFIFVVLAAYAPAPSYAQTPPPGGDPCATDPLSQACIDSMSGGGDPDPGSGDPGGADPCATDPMSQACIDSMSGGGDPDPGSGDPGAMIPVPPIP
ncbi:MAG: hypothetical protein QGG02_02510 [Gammaproteobacteria bacterium]|jgi:hypothetical protein|nr:hypothetical protein [Gammaproteobacteria bacterium]MDP6731178.1 hypothetical protein [Gammaproteobacteria bacterium]